MPQVSIARLFEDTREKLRLTWVAGREGAGKGIDSELTKDSSKGLVGHLNFIHPNLIQVLGDSEVNYLNGLGAAECRAMLEKASIRELACFIVAGGNPVPPALAEVAESTQTPLFSSPIPSVELMWIMRPHLARELAVLLTGDSGVGKSELGLELISRGSGLIADDIVELYRLGPESIEGRCPPILRDFLEVRGLGVLNIRTIFGEAALRPRKNVKLIVHLERPKGADPTHLERLPLKPGTESLMGVEIRKVTIPVAAGRNLAVLTEAAVRSYVLQMRGFDSTREFIERQERAMNNPGG